MRAPSDKVLAVAVKSAGWRILEVDESLRERVVHALVQKRQLCYPEVLHPREPSRRKRVRRNTHLKIIPRYRLQLSSTLR